MQEQQYRHLRAVDRRGTDCIKWDGMGGQFSADDLLPLWIADMDFQTPLPVREALRAVVDHGALGYHQVPEGYYQSFTNWQRQRHGVEVRREWLRYSDGVVPGLYWCVNFLTQPGDRCVILSPVYYPFMRAIRETGRKLVCSPLINENGVYSIDFARFEEDIIQNNAKLFILCTPHNPVGRVWKREELEGLLAVCKRHGVLVISDEIHQDFEMFGHRHIPALSLASCHDRLITFTAASKTFNIAGCRNSFAIIPDEGLRARYDAYLTSIGMNQGAMFGYIAAEAAYRGGAAWLEELLDAVQGNYTFLRGALERDLPKAVVSPLEGTYLMWVDIGAYVEAGAMEPLLEHDCKLAVDYGKWFCDDGVPDTHIRINLATPRENIELAARRLAEGIRTHPQ